MTACASAAMLAACGAAGVTPAARGLEGTGAITNARVPGEKILWNFTGGADGADPIGGPFADPAGNVYAGTIAGGSSDQGTVVRLAPRHGSYDETTLVTFQGRNGSSASGQLTMDSAGTLYGTTVWGGRYGYGSAFSISTNGRVRERVIWSFGGTSKDGANPDAGLVVDAQGVLYGTTAVGGPFGGGNVFKLTRAGRRDTETVLHDFGGAKDGKYPAAPVTLGIDGTVYGTAGGGGNGCSHGCGIVFKLTPSGSRYSESVLWNFRGATDGSGPSSGVTIDASGAMYGVTDFGGGTSCADGYGCGTVYKLTPSASGYTERVLWSFGKGTDGYYPLSNVVIGRNGTLYGTTWQGGTHYAGNLWELVPSGSAYAEKVLWNFTAGDDGGDPRGQMLADARGRLYATTYVGGTAGVGTVLRFTP